VTSGEITGVPLNWLNAPQSLNAAIISVKEIFQLVPALPEKSSFLCQGFAPEEQNCL
jgi:hypothetical protein